MAVETWYCLNGDKITQVQVERSTAAYVWVDLGEGVVRKTGRIGSTFTTSYFPTWKEAHAHLLHRAETKLAQARNALQLAQGFHGNVKGMKEPTP